MSQMTVNDWKLFLKARIAQEQGQDKKALTVFEDLLEKYPRHPHLLASRSFALSRSGRDKEATASVIAAKYAELGRALVGEADQPEAWSRELEGLVEQLDSERGNVLASALVAW